MHAGEANPFHRSVQRSKRGTRSGPKGWGCKELRKTNQEGSPSMRSKGAVAAGILFASGLSAPAWPAEFKITDDATFNAGIGLRAGYSRTDFGAPGGGSKSNKFSVGSARLFLGGGHAKMFKATLKTQRGGRG